MKLLVQGLFLIANLSYKGKASVDTFTPSNALLEEVPKVSDSSCYRQCKFNVKPRRCHFKFKVEPTVLEDGRPVISVNGMSPGPAIHVCVRDIIVVEVENRVPDEDIAIHWHGVEQKGTPYMDGVPMVTQCPIAFGATYKYAFRASSPGTFFYHSDSVTHQSDGVYGALIVNQPQALEPHSSLYDFDKIKENTMIISAQFPQLLTANLEDFDRQQPVSLMINGEKTETKFFVNPASAYRLRLINAIAVECPVTMSIDGHELLAIASDARAVKPVLTNKVLLYPGERMDVVVRASYDNGGYWVRVRGVERCAGLQADAMLLYSGFNYTSMLQKKLESKDIAETTSDSVIYGQKLESLQPTPYVAEVKPVYLGVDKNVVKFKDTDNDFRYISDAIPKKPFFPAFLSLQENGVIQINGKSFLYPSTPYLLKSDDLPQSSVCVVGEESKHQEPQCLHVLNANEGEVLEIALVNEGLGSSDSYTFHIHGLAMQVVATWKNPENTPVTKDDFRRLEKGGKIIRNLENAPVKDTVVVPNKGFTIVRVKADQGGSWMLECRSCSLFSLPTAVLININLKIPKSVLDVLPKCGSFRPPDVLLH